ncbi:MAG: hypothetical protein LC777_14250 [Actinobacteria bacterium]|nr:hypothetical protein [Actinomycetota bacterium]
MPVAHEPELLIELLHQAGRAPGGRIGLLRAPEVADILGRHREWVHEHALTLGGLRLPASSKWRFCPRGVAYGVLGLQHTISPEHRPPTPDPGRRRPSRRLSYPPAKDPLPNRSRGTRGNQEQNL